MADKIFSINKKNYQSSAPAFNKNFLKGDNMVRAAFEDLGRLLKKMFVIGCILLVIFVPLGIWKLIDLIHAYVHHVAK